LEGISMENDHPGKQEAYAVKSFLTHIKQLAASGFQWLHQRFALWTTPPGTSPVLGAVEDLFRSKPQLVAENALLRQ
jgi:hypothetical protein